MPSRNPLFCFGQLDHKTIHGGCPGHIMGLRDIFSRERNFSSEMALRFRPPSQKMAIHRVDIGERELLASQNLRKGELLSSSVTILCGPMRVFRKILDGLTISLLFRENRTRFYTGLRQNLICTWKLHRFENGQSKESLMLLGREILYSLSFSQNSYLMCRTLLYLMHSLALVLSVWVCHYCPSLQNSMMQQEVGEIWISLLCNKCVTPHVTSVIRFWIELPMDDGKDRAMFVVFDKEMTKLTKQEAFVLALEEIPNSGDEELPSCLGELARKEFFFQIRVTLFNFTIPSLYDQLSLKISSLTIRLWWVNLWEGGLSRASSSEAVVALKLGMGGDTATPPGIEEVEKTCKSRR
ncbi:hypothetical protein HID58_066558 [Brassica napus]|uniref:Replication factor A C-terminal domain-containing protein n=1 Tax=Brassica napus TaxID=3708 RepID=A0ABQ7ZFZ4_BRANA|nr:hypothetical protein HID58_066558 [Brassica napus]